jgi:hypothetical protein
MQGPNSSTKSFKQAFLKNLLLDLQLHARGCASSLNERKRAVRTSADKAMAAARGTSSGARWPKAILALASAATPAPSSHPCKMHRCRRTVIRCRGRKRSYVARRLVRKKTMALREVIPGGRDAALDEAILLRETMDYVVHLRAQVDVLCRVSEAVQRSGSIIRQVRDKNNNTFA